MKTSFLLLLAIAAPLLSQNQDVIKVVRVRHEPSWVANGLNGQNFVHYAISNPLHAVVISGSQDNVAKLEKVITDLDSLGDDPTSVTKNVNLTAYAIVGLNDSPSDFKEATGDAVLAIIKQLRAVFPYSHYGLAFSTAMRSSQSGQGGSAGLFRIALPPPIDSRPTGYRLTFDNSVISGGANPLIHIENLKFSATLGLRYCSGSPEEKPCRSYSGDTKDVGINTNVDLREGQKVVIGKLNIADYDTGLFLVVEARLVP